MSSAHPIADTTPSTSSFIGLRAIVSKRGSRPALRLLLKSRSSAA